MQKHQQIWERGDSIARMDTLYCILWFKTKQMMRPEERGEQPTDRKKKSSVSKQAQVLGNQIKMHCLS